MWLEEQLTSLDDDLTHTIQWSAVEQATEAVLQRSPGVGPVLSRILLGQVPELGTLGHKQVRLRSNPTDQANCLKVSFRSLLRSSSTELCCIFSESRVSKAIIDVQPSRLPFDTHSNQERPL